MKNLIRLLPLVLVSVLSFPLSSNAQGFFGGLSTSVLPATCSLPEFYLIPNCPLGQPPFAPPNVPLFTFQTFFPLYINTSFPVFGVLAVPIAAPLIFTPLIHLLPGFWGLGTLIPPTSQPGFYLPGIIVPTFHGVYCIPSQCIPFFPALGIVTPATGASLGI